MSIDTIKQTAPDHLTKILTMVAEHSTAPYSGGVDQFTINHNLGYIPPFKIFYQLDDHPERWFPNKTSYDGNVPSLSLNNYTKFTFVPQITPNQIIFGVTNRDTATRIIKVVAIIYAEKAAASA